MSLIVNIIEVVIGLFGCLVCLRAYLWTLAITPRDPMVRFVWRFTDWLVNPMGYVFRPMGNWDWSSIASAFLLSLIEVLLLRELFGFPVTAPSFVLMWVALPVRWMIDLLTWGLIIYCVMSFAANPMSPYMAMMYTLVDPFLRPFRRFIPLVGRFDFSPIVLFLLLSFIQRYVSAAASGLMVL